MLSFIMLYVFSHFIFREPSIKSAEFVLSPCKFTEMCCHLVEVLDIWKYKAVMATAKFC